MMKSKEKQGKIPNGMAAAAYLSAMIGMLTLALVVVVCEASSAFTKNVHALGRLWMPGAESIGPYSGKETLALLAWILSWIILHFLLKGKELRGGFWLTVFLVGVGIATTLNWPPIWGFLLRTH